GNGVPYIDVEGSGLHKTQTWRVTNTPLRLLGLTTVQEALSIAPGVQLWMAANASMTVFGSINAVGTSASRITIRGEKAVRGFWESIDVRSAGALNELSYVDVRHGGGGTGGGTRANVSVSSNAQMRVHNATFEESADAGMEVERFGLLPAFSNNRFHNNAGAGLRVPAEEAGALDPASSYSTGNGVPYIDVEGSGLHKTQTWRVTNTPLRLLGLTTVQGALSIAPGVQLWMAANASMTVFGSVNAVGTSASRITVRGEQAVRGFWETIDFRSSSSLNELAYVDALHGGGGSGSDPANVTAGSNARLRVNFSSFSESAGWGLFAGPFAVVTPSPLASGGNTFSNNAKGASNIP
ncbi:MAG: hypothetical protein Q8K82_25200, partial [Gemmatimonadaceae bacterium]|nr:hypothetical protein [Gemmatimonadaceae bacterium]